MPNKTKYLYRFLSACSGNWRNAIAVSCASCPYSQAHPCAGYLLAFDHDGKMIPLPAASLVKMTGECIDLHECHGQMTRLVFEELFAQYLIWHTASPHHCPLQQLQEAQL